MSSTITFDGPSLLDPQSRSVTVVETSDEALLLVTEALCARFGWTPELGVPPGKFAIEQTVKWWTDLTTEYVADRDATVARASAKESLVPMVNGISIVSQ